MFHESLLDANEASADTQAKAIARTVNTNKAFAHCRGTLHGPTSTRIAIPAVITPHKAENRGPTSRAEIRSGTSAIQPSQLMSRGGNANANSAPDSRDNAAAMTK